MVSTKKDFIATAKILAKTKAKPIIVNEFISKFKNENPRFDEQRFRKFIMKKKKENTQLKLALEKKIINKIKKARSSVKFR